MLSRLKNYLWNSLLLVSSIIFGILAIEAGLWGFHLPPYPEGNYNVLEPDQENGYRFRPNAVSSRSSWEFDTPVKINSIGLRDYGSVNKDSMPYAFLLGDSFAEGHGVNIEQTIAKKLQVKSGKLVANLGIASSGTTQQNNIFRRNLQVFSRKPKYAILIFYVGNDFYDNRRFYDHFTGTGNTLQTVSNGYLVDDATSITKEMGGWLIWRGKDGKEIRRSMNYAFHPPKGYENKFLDWSKIYNMLAWIDAPRNNSCQVNDATPGLYGSSPYDLNASIEWRITQKMLSDFVKLANDNSITPVLVVMPSKFQLNQKWLKQAGCDIQNFNPNQTINILENFAKQNKIISVNLAKSFSALPLDESEKLYYTIDVHLTPWGNDFAASVIFKALNWD